MVKREKKGFSERPTLEMELSEKNDMKYPFAHLHYLSSGIGRLAGPGVNILLL